MVNEGGTILGSSIDAVNEVMSSHEDWMTWAIFIKSIWNLSLNFSHIEKSLYFGSENSYKHFPILIRALNLRISNRLISSLKNSNELAWDLIGPLSKIFRSPIYSIILLTDFPWLVMAFLPFLSNDLAV
jgi:hypothetical protein